jgi:hypothetical protein
MYSAVLRDTSGTPGFLCGVHMYVPHTRCQLSASVSADCLGQIAHDHRGSSSAVIDYGACHCRLAVHRAQGYDRTGAVITLAKLLPSDHGCSCHGPWTIGPPRQHSLSIGILMSCILNCSWSAVDIAPFTCQVGSSILPRRPLTRLGHQRVRLLGYLWRLGSPSTVTVPNFVPQKTLA